MLAEDEDALICDLAETYHIYDYRSVPVKLLATLASGLRDDARIKIKLRNDKVSFNTFLLCSIVDQLNLFLWGQSKDGLKGVNRPKSIVDVLFGNEKEVKGFESYLYKNRYSRPHRESLAQRIQYMIKDKEFGIAKSVAPIFYGDLKVDSSKCTLCLSCVGACNVNAIFAKSDDFSLRFNPSLCTTCGYCVELF